MSFDKKDEKRYISMSHKAILEEFMESVYMQFLSVFKQRTFGFGFVSPEALIEWHPEYEQRRIARRLWESLPSKGRMYEVLRRRDQIKNQIDIRERLCLIPPPPKDCKTGKELMRLIGKEVHVTDGFWKSFPGETLCPLETNQWILMRMRPDHREGECSYDFVQYSKLGGIRSISVLELVWCIHVLSKTGANLEKIWPRSNANYTVYIPTSDHGHQKFIGIPGHEQTWLLRSNNEYGRGSGYKFFVQNFLKHPW